MRRYLHRELEAHQTALLGTVDRSEAIDGLYRCVDGVLRLEPVRQQATAWQGAELDALVARLELLEQPDPELFAREPEDIHLCLRLA